MSTQPAPRFAAALSTAAGATAAVREACDSVRAQLDGPPDFAITFASQALGPDFEGLARALCDALGTENLLGCTGESIVGGSREIEDGPALSVWAARWPGVTTLPMCLDFVRTSEGGSIVGWPDDLPDPWPAGASLLLLGEPFSFPADALLARLNEQRPGVPVVGGMASGGWQPGQNRLWLGPRVLDQGAVAALIHGQVTLRTVVSQGCRPIGRPMVVTRAERNVIMELSGQPALYQLGQLLPEMSEAERDLVRSGLHVGRVMNEYQDGFKRGDFLIANVVDVDPKSGAIAVGAYVRPGQTVQFHVRDAGTADEDLRELLSATKGGPAPLGALLFTCNGRGSRMFPEPDHDAGVTTEILGKLPLAGFFAQGEIGPVAGKNYIHGFTASVVLFGGASGS